MKEILPDLKNVIFSVFQEMFFVFPDEYDENVDFLENWKKVRIKIYSNDKEIFYFNLYFTQSQALIMTENFLGQSDDLSPSLLDETLKEAANVIGGNFLNTFKKDYNLGIPEILDCEKKNILKKQYEDGKGILLNMEGEPFLLLVN